MPGAGSLDQRIAVDSVVSASDGYGGTTSGFAEQFQTSAAYIHLRGGEAVMAARLEGKHTQIIRVRSSTQTRQITTDWRVRDTRTGDVFNVRDVTPSDDRAWIDLLCEKGVAV